MGCFSDAVFGTGVRRKGNGHAANAGVNLIELTFRYGQHGRQRKTNLLECGSAISVLLQQAAKSKATGNASSVKKRMNVMTFPCGWRHRKTKTSVMVHSDAISARRSRQTHK